MAADGRSVCRAATGECGIVPDITWEWDMKKPYNNRLVRYAAAALMATWAMNANSHDLSDYDKQYSACVDRNGPINNSVVMICSEEVSERVKSDMNRYYKIAYARLASQSAEDAARLESAQRAWLIYRDTHSDLAGAYVGSPMYGYCPMELNKSRVDELRELAE